MKVRKNFRLESDVVKGLELLVQKGYFTNETAAIEMMVKHHSKKLLKNESPINDPFNDWSKN